MREATDSTRINLYVPNRLLGAARRLAKYQGITLSELVRTALVAYIRSELTRCIEEGSNDGSS
jgi:post-segregation antitoxin (ccd killing protein)